MKIHHQQEQTLMAVVQSKLQQLLGLGHGLAAGASAAAFFYWSMGFIVGTGQGRLTNGFLFLYKPTPMRLPFSRSRTSPYATLHNLPAIWCKSGVVVGVVDFRPKCPVSRSDLQRNGIWLPWWLPRKSPFHPFIGVTVRKCGHFDHIIFW